MIDEANAYHEKYDKGFLRWQLPVGAAARPRPDAADLTSAQVCQYSGPEPPSGGVRRPPLAEMAPHCTQFDGAISTVDEAVVARGADGVDLRRAQVRPQLGDVGRHALADEQMWFGWSSRVLLPEANTDDSLSKVSLPSCTGLGRRAIGLAGAGLRRRARCASTRC